MASLLSKKEENSVILSTIHDIETVHQGSRINFETIITTLPKKSLRGGLSDDDSPDYDSSDDDSHNEKKNRQ